MQHPRYMMAPSRLRELGGVVKRWREIIDDKAGTYVGKVGNPQMAISVSLAPYRAQSSMSFLTVDLAGTGAGGVT